MMISITFNYKIPTDNLRLSRHIRDNRVGLVRHAADFPSTNIVILSEHENSNDNA